MVQIDENVRAYAKHLPLRVATVYGGVSERPQISALHAGADIVIPEYRRQEQLLRWLFREEPDA